MSISEEENEFDDDEENCQWSPFKEYSQCHALGISLDHNVVRSLIQESFPVKDQETKIPYEGQHAALQENVQNLPTFLSGNDVASECKWIVVNLKKESASTWNSLLSNFFQKKLIEPGAKIKWRRNFLHVLSLDVVEEIEEHPTTSNKCSSLDTLFYHNKKAEVYNKRDPIYSSFGRLSNGFHVSSNGVLFSSESELKKFNAKMAAMAKELTCEWDVIQHQHSELKAKAEERKLLSQRTESREESDHDDEPSENQQFTKQTKPKDKTLRKSGLFASLSASLSAARSGIQGFWEKSASSKEPRHSPQPVAADDSEDETGNLTPSPNSRVSTVDGIDNHDEFTRQMETKGGLMYESVDKTVQHLSHDALPPPLSLQALQGGTQMNK